jgi:GlcNAc-P-P-Und epimerase
MNKIIITGASGFIGTNLLEYCKNKEFEIVNIDITEPRSKEHHTYWQKVDICDYKALKKLVDEIKPDYIVHLAARTDLNEKDGLEYYSANIQGVENIVKICGKDSGIKRVIFASSMLVNEVGYKPKYTFDYNPSTLYGQSKVLSEKIVFDNKDNLTEFCIIRPTSIWGEWFAEPYKNFFDFVLAGKFFHPGEKACTKTYGYVGNAIYQIDKLLFADIEKIQEKVFYIGDKPAINISVWADEIAFESNISKPKKIPFLIFKFSGWFGDILGKFGVKFPMTSFRLKNMTTDHIVNLENTYEVCGDVPYNRINGVKNTIEWMKNK